MKMRLFLFFLVGLFAMSLAGCGGGGSSNLSGVLTLSATAPATSTDSGVATATYVASSGKNPLGLEINFSTDRPDIVALDSTKQSVGVNGQARITFRAITPATDTNVKINAVTGGLTTFQVVTIKGSGGGVTTPPPVVPTTSVNAIAFNSASPASITLKGTGGAGRVETSIVTFTVKDNTGQPMASQIVDFSLNTSVGGIVLTPSSATSDSSGVVKTIVNSGVVSTPVRVTATVRATSISAQSDQLTITTGIPDQNHLTMSIQTLNSETFSHNGVSIPVSVILSDHFGNPVPDGTAVNFTSNVGQIGASATTTNGAATVNWISSEPRVFVGPQRGRFVIMAYAIGEESFTDANGNGLADAGEFTDTTEAFLDLNDDGVRDATEPFFDFNGDGAFNAGDGIFNGVLQGAAFAGTPRSKHIFVNHEFVMSTDGAVITANPASLSGPGGLLITIQDLNGNTMAAGTTVAVTTPFGTMTGQSSFTVPQNTGFGQTIGVNIAASATPAPQAGLITITVTSPGGLSTVKTVPISGNF